MPPLLTEQDVAKRLAISARSVSRMRTAGGGPRYLKIKHSVRYRESDLEAFLAAKSRASTSETRPLGGLVPPPLAEGLGTQRRTAS
jgi:predicted DNA-binding transcriptional regulator AlpA